MGRASRMKTIHRSKLFGGRMTAQEVHAKLGVRKPCQYCKTPVAPFRIRVMAPVDELLARHPKWCAAIAAANPNGPYIPSVETKYGRMTCVVDFGFCTRCRKQCEHDAARMPDYLLIDFDYGPGEDKVVVGSSGTPPT